MTDLDRSYFGQNYDKAVANVKTAVTAAKRDFLAKYPKADISRFSFQANFSDNSGDVSGVGVYYVEDGGISINITSDTFQNNPSMQKWITSGSTTPTDIPLRGEGFPKIWYSGGTIKPIPKKYSSVYNPIMGGTERTLDHEYPTTSALNYPISNFYVFVGLNKGFLSRLPVFRVTYPNTEELVWNDDNDFVRLVFAVYCASWCCGVSMQHLTPDPAVYPVITSLMRFHLYFTTRRLLRRMEGGERMSAISREFGAGDIYGHVHKLPWTFVYKNVRSSTGHYDKKNVRVLQKGYASMYKRYVPTTSDGLTDIGRQYLNQSIEAFVYAILGAQAKTRVSIVGKSAGSLETQQEFRKLVEDSVVNYSTSTWILNMRRAIKDTNVVQNLAVSPSTWLMPSDVVILKRPIPGYNNLLKTATDTMTFGVNGKLNYTGVSQNHPKQTLAFPSKTHQKGGEHLENLNPKTPVTPVTPVPTPSHSGDSGNSRDSGDKTPRSNKVALWVLSTVGAFVLTKYVL